MIHKNVTTVRDFVRIWFQWKPQAYAAFGCIVLLAILYAYLATPKYESTAKIVVLPKTDEGVVVTAGLSENHLTPATLEDINTELEILTSREVIARTIQSFIDQGQKVSLSKKNDSWTKVISDALKNGIKQTLLFLELVEPISEFEGYIKSYGSALKVEPVPLSSVINISLKAEDPRVAQIALARYLQIYIKSHQQVFSQSNGYDFYDDQVKQFQKEMDTTEKKLYRTQKEIGIVDLNLLNQKNAQIMTTLEQQENQLSIQLEETKNRIDLLGMALSEDKDEIALTREMQSFPVIADLNKALVPLLLRKNEISKTYTENSREYKDIIGELKMLQEQKKSEIRKAIDNEMMEMKSLEGRQAAARKEIENMRMKTLDLNRKWQDISDLKMKADFESQSYRLYTSKRQDALAYSERKNRDLTNVSIANPATLPIKRDWPNRLLIILFSIFLGGLAALCSPFILEFFDQRLKTAGDVETVLGVPVVSTFLEEIPETKEAPESEKGKNWIAQFVKKTYAKK